MTRQAYGVSMRSHKNPTHSTRSGGLEQIPRLGNRGPRAGCQNLIARTTSYSSGRQRGSLADTPVCSCLMKTRWSVVTVLTFKGSVVGQPLPNPKRKRQLEEDVMEPTDVLDEASVTTQKAKPSKKQKQEVDEEDAPVNVTLFNTRSSLKVGPPRGVRKRHPTHSQPFSSGPALRSSRGDAKATNKTEETSGVSLTCKFCSKLIGFASQPLSRNSATPRGSHCVSPRLQMPKAPH